MIGLFVIKRRVKWGKSIRSLLKMGATEIPWKAPPRGELFKGNRIGLPIGFADSLAVLRGGDDSPLPEGLQSFAGRTVVLGGKDSGPLVGGLERVAGTLTPSFFEGNQSVQ